MSSTIIEEDRGTIAQTAPHRHNGYSGGDFSGPADPAALAPWFAWGNAESKRHATPAAVRPSGQS